MSDKGLLAFLSTIKEADAIVEEVTNPHAKELDIVDVRQFMETRAVSISSNMLWRGVRFDISERGVEVYNPRKFGEIH